MNHSQISLLPSRSVANLVEDVETLTKEIQELYSNYKVPIVIGWSGGKDSTCVLQLIWNAVASLPVEKRTNKLHVITNDTLVENPIVSHWVSKSLEKIKISAEEQNMPVMTHLTYPKVQDRFWVCLIGKGYPAPRRRFRWCTDRMKIKPTDSFISQLIRNNGETILALGTRKAESTARAINMAKHREWRVKDRLNLNPSRPNSFFYLPIEDWSTDEVWLYLMQWENPWGIDNKQLLKLYRGATADNECPLVVDTSTPSCGSSRFGCWVCTLVDKDKSMEAMIQNDEEKEWLQPLLDLRNELDIQNDREKRDFRRLNGNVQLYERNIDGKISIEPVPGPYTKYWREYWLRKILSAQIQIRNTAPDDMKNITLITLEELSEIRRIWLEEKHEFDDSLPKIYEEVTGETFRDPDENRAKSILGNIEWETINEICGEDTMFFELMTKLIDTERQYSKQVRRKGIYEALEKCFQSSSRSKESAIAHAKLKWEMKKASQEADFNTIKQLTWGMVKFNKASDSEDEG